MRSLLKISFAFACLVLIDDIVFLLSIDNIVFIAFETDLGASAVSHRAEAWRNNKSLLVHAQHDSARDRALYSVV